MTILGQISQSLYSQSTLFKNVTSIEEEYVSQIKLFQIENRVSFKIVYKQTERRRRFISSQIS